MILLELTETELNIIAKAMATEQKLDEQMFFNEKEKKEALCVSVMTKIEAARIEPKDELITSKDFEGMISIAKQNYTRLGTEIFITNKKVEENFLTYLCFMESFVAWLNGKKLLKRLAKFDFTDKRW